MACGQSARQTRSKGACAAHSHYRHFLYYFFFPHNKIFLDLLQEHKSHITLVLHSQHVFDAVPGCSTMQVIYVGSRQCSKDKFHLSSDLLRDNQVISLCFRYNPTECGYDAIFLWNMLLEWIGIKKNKCREFPETSCPISSQTNWHRKWKLSTPCEEFKECEEQIQTKVSLGKSSYNNKYLIHFRLSSGI